MANWWDSAPLANAPTPVPSSGNWWEAAPLASSKPDVLSDVGQSFGTGVTHSLPDLANTVAAGLNTVAEGVTRKVTGDPSYNRTFSDFKNAGDKLTTDVVGQNYQPQTTPGRYAKAIGYGVGSAPLGATSVPNAVRSLVAGATGGVGSEAGGDVAVATTGDEKNRIYGQLLGGGAAGLKGDNFTNDVIKGTQSTAARIAPDSQALRQLASDSYKAADAVGGTLNANVTNRLIDSATNLKPQTRAGLALAGKNDVTDLVDNLSTLKDTSLSLQEAQEIDEHLGDLIDSHTQLGKVDKQGKKLLDFQNSLRDVIHNANSEDITGGTEGFDALQKARPLWSQSLKLKDVERIIDKANLTDNPATALRTGFKNLATNPQKTRGYTPDEIKALRNAAKTGVVGDTLRVFGSRLIPIGSAAFGGVPGAIAGQAGASLSRAGATALQNGRANQAAELLARGSNPSAGEKLGMGLRDLFGGTPSGEIPPMSPGVMQSLSGEASMGQNMQNPDIINRLPNKNTAGSIDPKVAAGIGIGTGAGALALGASQLGKQKPVVTPQTDEIGTLLNQLETQQDQTNLNSMMDATPASSFLDKIRKAESSGVNTAKAATSSALGPFQFTRKTWQKVIDKYAPDELKKRPDLMNLRTDPELSRFMAQKLADENAGALQKQSVPVTDGSLYVAHFAGGPRAARLYKANPKAPASKFFADFEIKANPTILRGKSVGQVIKILENKVT